MNKAKVTLYVFGGLLVIGFIDENSEAILRIFAFIILLAIFAALGFAALYILAEIGYRFNQASNVVYALESSKNKKNNAANKRKDEHKFWVYTISSPDGRIYIGETTAGNPAFNRWQSHRRDLQRGRHANDGLVSMYNDYGLDGLRFDIIQEGTANSKYGAKRQALRHEADYIHEYKMTNIVVNEKGA